MKETGTEDSSEGNLLPFAKKMQRTNKSESVLELNLEWELPMGTWGGYPNSLLIVYVQHESMHPILSQLL